MYLSTRIFPTTGYARVLLFMFIRRELGWTRTGCLFQFTYCDYRLLQMRRYNIFTHFAKPRGFISTQMHCKKVAGKLFRSADAYIVLTL